MSVRRKLLADDVPPLPLVELRAGKLLPASPLDARMMQAFPFGQEFDLKPRSERADRRRRHYFLILHAVVDATGHWASAKQLHNELMLTLGYTTQGIDLLNKSSFRVADKLTVESMGQEAFNEYMERALGKLARHIGCDPVTLLREGAR